MISIGAASCWMFGVPIACRSEREEAMAVFQRTGALPNPGKKRGFPRLLARLKRHVLTEAQLLRARAADSPRKWILTNTGRFH